MPDLAECTLKTRKVHFKLCFIYRTLGKHTYASKFNLDFTMVLLWFTALLCNSFVFSGGPEIRSVRLCLWKARVLGLKKGNASPQFWT